MRRMVDDAFAPLARRLQRRIAARTALRTLRGTATPLFGAALIALVGIVAAQGALPRGAGVVALFVVAAWLSIALAAALLRMPTHEHALAAFDHAMDNGELFLSAHELRTSQRAGALLHAERARRALPAAREDVPDALPLPRGLTPAWLTPVAFVTLVFSLPVRGIDATPGTASQPEAVPPPATTLQERAAEAVARAAASDDDPLASARVLDALERHADTARLADALRAQDLEQASGELHQLARRLRLDGLSDRAKKRMARALDDASDATDPSARATGFARHADAARAALRTGRADGAGDALERLAARLHQRAGRLRGAKALGTVADRLRALGAREGLLDARHDNPDPRGPARIGVGTAPYTPDTGTVHPARRDERVVVAPGTSAPGGERRAGPDPVRPAQPPGTSRTRFETVPEAAASAGSIPASRTDAVQRYFARLRGR